jgi:hypothetical protein
VAVAVAQVTPIKVLAAQAVAVLLDMLLAQMAQQIAAAVVVVLQTAEVLSLAMVVLVLL